jgi:hypothetical protein
METVTEFECGECTCNISVLPGKRPVAARQPHVSRINTQTRDCWTVKIDLQELLRSNLLLPNQPNANRMRRFAPLCPAPRAYSTTNMPNLRVHIVSEALPPLALAAVCRDAHALADCDNFWVTKVSLMQSCCCLFCSGPAPPGCLLLL